MTPHAGAELRWGKGVRRRDPGQNGVGSWMCVLGASSEMILLDVSDLPFLRVLPTPPTLAHSLLHMVPATCQAPWGRR